MEAEAASEVQGRAEIIERFPERSVSTGFLRQRTKERPFSISEVVVVSLRSVVTLTWCLGRTRGRGLGAASEAAVEFLNLQIIGANLVRRALSQLDSA